MLIYINRDRMTRVNREREAAGSTTSEENTGMFTPSLIC